MVPLRNLNRFYTSLSQYLIWTVLISGSMVLYLYQHVAVMDLAEELGMLREEKVELLDEQQRLSMNVARLSNGKRIVDIASKSLSMQAPPILPEIITERPHRLGQ